MNTQERKGTIDHFSILRKVLTDEHYKIYIAQDEITKKHALLKVFKCVTEEHIDSEVAILEKLNHPNIMQL